mmetsp:Transcript_37618/g.111625  ORF Transcript_37618/g.111625 Transcript_37618/m.111625 type:complete len:229 (-) Transcript_37618:9-695(-)
MAVVFATYASLHLEAHRPKLVLVVAGLLQLPRTVARVLQLPRHEPCGVQLLGSEANLFQVLRGEVRQLQLRGVEAHLLEGCGTQASDFPQVVGADPGHAEMLPVERQLQQHLDERGAVRRLHHRRVDRVLRPAVPQLPEPVDDGHHHLVGVVEEEVAGRVLVRVPRASWGEAAELGAPHLREDVSLHLDDVSADVQARDHRLVGRLGSHGDQAFTPPVHTKSFAIPSM